MGVTDWTWLFVVAIIGYLIGSLNGSLLLSKVFFKDDIRRHGSGNAGATNVLRVHGKKWTVLVSAWDMGKGALAVWLGSVLLNDIGSMIAGLGVILGHVFPLYFGFKGGKGVITACMVMLMLDWQVACIALAFFFALVLWKRYISLGSIVAVVTLPVTSLILGRPVENVILCVIVMALITALHRANIKRLLSGTEHKFGEKP